MSYFARQYKDKSRHKIILISPPNAIINYHYYLSRAWQYLVALYLKVFLTENDKVLFFEYPGDWRSGDHSAIAQLLRKWNVRNHLSGLIHLSKNHLLETLKENELIQKLQLLDDIIVMGSSLERYFFELGFSKKTVRTFLYADVDFYKPNIHNNPSDKKILKIIAMGSLKRNHHLINSIATQCPDVEFLVCSGKSKSDAITSKNIAAQGYMEEDLMLDLMQQSDISLSIMEDTVASNVIVCSLACGLINIASDVGSIRDYCEANSSILCTTVDDFVLAINNIAKMKNMADFKLNARHHALTISLDESVKWYDNFLE